MHHLCRAFGIQSLHLFDTILDIILMKALVLCQVVDRKVHDDRGVSHSISPFGKNVLELSEPLLHKLRIRIQHYFR